jgi:hypothetical protein
MRLPILVVGALLMSCAGFAQDKPPVPDVKPESLEAVIIPVKTLTGDSFNRLVKLLAVFNAHYTADDKLRTIIVYAPKDVVAQMRHVVEELDRPGSDAAIGRNIDLTLSFLRCSTKAPAGASSLPADLEPVARQLRAATQYKDIELWDVVPLRLQEGKDTDQTMRMPGKDLSSGAPGSFVSASVRIRPESVGRKGQDRYVRFDSVKISFQMPSPNGVGGFNYRDVGLNTSGDFVEGQKTVLGKVSGIDDDSAVFVVISLKVLE